MSDVQQVMGLVARLSPVKPQFSGDESSFIAWLLAIEARLLSTGVKVDDIKQGNDPKLTSEEDLSEAQTKQLDAAVFGLVVQSVTGLALTAISHGPRSGSKALKTLIDRYAPAGEEHVNMLKQQLRSIQFLPEDNANSFLTRVASLQGQIRACGKEFSDDDLRQVIALALPPRFDLCMRLLSRDDPPPTITRITSALLQEDRIQQRRETMYQHRGAEQAMVASTGFRRQDRSPAKGQHSAPTTGKCVDVTCTFCGKHGHCAQRCYKLASALKYGLIVPADVLGQLRAHAKRTNIGAADSKQQLYLLSATYQNVTTSEQCWVVDSGATAHMTPNKHLLSDYTPIQQGERYIVLADKSRIAVHGVGSCHITLTNSNNKPVNVCMANVLYAPQLTFQLFSANVATQSHMHKLSVQHDASYLHLLSGDDIPFSRSSDGALLTLWVSYTNMQGERSQPTSGSQQHYEPTTHHQHPRALQTVSEQQHRLYGHKHDRAVERILHQQTPSQPVCEPCELAKSKRTSIAKQAQPRDTLPLDLLFGDLCGPLPHSRGYFTWVFAIIDDASRFAWTFLLRNKTDVHEAMQLLRTNRFVSGALPGAMLQTDSEPLFKSTAFRATCMELDVQQRFSPPHSQAKNGVVERYFRTLFETVRVLLFSCGLPDYFWEDAVRHATVLYNITPRQGKSAPISQLHDRYKLPTLYEFGSVAYVNIAAGKRRKLEPRARKGIYLGCDLEDSSHRIYILSTSQVVNSIHVTIGEVQDWSSHFSATHEDESEQDQQQQTSTFFTDDWFDATLPTSQETSTTDSEPTSDPAQTDDSDAVMDTTVDDPILEDFVMVAACDLPDPVTIAQALASPESEDWMDGIRQEFASMEANRVFELLDSVPAGSPVLQSKLVFKRKKDVNGRTVRYKVRWVCKGFTQTEGVDYHETFAPTTDLTSLRLLLSLATSKGMYLQQMDVDTAFLHADVDADIYVRIPKGLDFIFPKGQQVCKLNKSLYGLKQAPHLWNERLNKFFLSVGFKRLYSDLCVYALHSEGGETWVSIYVDDLIIAASTPQLMTQFKTQISEQFTMKDLGSPHLCLGMRITYDREAKLASIGQEHYIKQILKDFNMQDCKPARTPLPTNYNDKQSNDEEPASSEPCDAPFGSLVGKLLYAATCTRPDIATAVSMLCSHMKSPTKVQWQAAKHVLRYLKATATVVIQYTGKDAYLSAYSDASYATDPIKCRSRTGNVIFFASGPVSWHTKLQPTIATSSAEAEYMALAQTAKEVQYLRTFIEELTNKALSGPTTVYADNTASIKVATSSSTRMKHIKIRFHYIKQCIEEGTIVLEHCATDQMIADILTKALGKDKTDTFRRALLKTTSDVVAEAATPRE